MVRPVTRIFMSGRSLWDLFKRGESEVKNERGIKIQVLCNESIEETRYDEDEYVLYVRVEDMMRLVMKGWCVGDDNVIIDVKD